MDTHVAGNPSQTHPIDVHLYGFLAELGIVSLMFLCRGIVLFTEVTSIFLATRSGFANLVLVGGLLASRTFHGPI